MADVVYRFLPWARRGLAAALPAETGPAAAVPARAKVAVQVVVAGAGAASTSAVLHGPGDVIGLDTSQVVRTYPRAHTTDAEPNYLAAVDLDAPELPWLFTPRGVPVNGKLSPWLVLVVVEARPGVEVTLPVGAPLPQLRIENGAGAELPDLTDSWAWAHVQLVEPTGGAADVGAVLGAQPDRNVARLMCPRRLAPGRRWIAAVVPAFDAGVARGLGGEPRRDRPLGPAWTAEDAVTLPTYFHWEFQTGPEGDFEALAQRLKPHKAAATVGVVTMHVGEGGPPVRVPLDQTRVLEMDGALRAPLRSDGTLAEVPSALSAGLQRVTRTLADAADGVLDGRTLLEEDRQPVGPPVYASSHVRRWRVEDTDAEWFRELNLDPRPRVAAGLGAECVRENQEDIVHAAWQQVGDVLAAQAALQRAALAKLVSGAFHRRHLARMPDDRLLALVGPAAARTPLDGRSLTAAVAATSLPDAVLDAGLRRALAPAGRAVARAATRVGMSPTQLRPGLVGALARGRQDVDPTRFTRPTLSGVPAAALEGRSDLRALGLPITVAPDVVNRLAGSAEAATTAVRGAERLVLDPNVRAGGLVGQAHVEAARELATRAGIEIGAAVDAGEAVDLTTVTVVSTGAILDRVRAGAPSGAGRGVGLVVRGPVLDRGRIADPTAPVTVDVLDVAGNGTLVLRDEHGGIPLARLDVSLSGGDLVDVVSRLPAGTLTVPATGAARPVLDDLPVLARGSTTGPVTVGTSVLRAGVARATGPLARGPIAAGPGAAGPTVRGPIPSGPIVLGPLRPGQVVVVTGPVTGPVVTGPVTGPVVTPGPVVFPAPGPPTAGPASVTMPPLILDTAVIGRFETALALQRDTTALAVEPAVGTLVRFRLDRAATAVRAHLDPSVGQPLRRDELLSFAGRVAGSLFGRAHAVDGWWATRAIDRIMAYPTFPVPAYRYLSAYDRTRFCPGIDDVPPDSVTLLETNPRFVAAFMAGLNHETNRELLWRGYPTDARGTPFRRFWSRLDGRDDIPPVHGWRSGSLAQQTTDPRGNLVLLLRGDLLRRYPNTIVVAVRAVGPREPSQGAADLVQPVFAGQLEPDVSFFGFPLQDTDLDDGAGWFFALMEPVTEPRFGLDETRGGRSAGGGGVAADALSWPDTDVAPGGHLASSGFGRIGLNQAAIGAHDLATTLFQKPFALYVHARHLLAPLPVQR